MQWDSDSVQAFTRALKALAEGEIETAAAIARGLFRRWPEDPSTCQLMAAVALRKLDAAAAERLALASLTARPDHCATLILAAQAARAMGNLSTALERFRRVADLEPTRPEAAFGGGAALIVLDPPQAGAVLDDLLRRFPDHAAEFAEIGGLLEQGGQWGLAARAYANAARVRPSAKLFVRHGSVLQSLGRRDQAVISYQTALQLDPASFEAWFKLGLALQDGRRPDRAAEAYRQALLLRPDLAEAEVNLGVALQELGDLAAAKQAYGRAMKLMPAAFGRIAQALTTAPKGELWMDLGVLRAHLSELGRLSR